MFGNPFFSEYDDGYYHRPRSINQQRRLRAAAVQEEARRRAALERHYREQERLRRREEYARRLREHQREEDAYENELRRRRAILQDRELQEYMRQTYGTEHENTMRSRKDFGDSVQEDEPIYQMIRGSDGRVYRVRIGSRKTALSNSQHPETKKKSWDCDNKRVPSLEGTIHRKNTVEELEIESGYEESIGIPNNKEKDRSQKSLLQNEYQGEDWPGFTSKDSRNAPRVTPGSSRKKKGAKNRVTIIVEDVSDSETEDDFSKSPWRNRRPSPGEWMEPVESYDKL